MVVRRADRRGLPVWPLGADFLPDLGGIWRDFQRPDKEVRHSCPHGVALVGGDLLGTPLDTNNYFHTCPCLLAFMSPGFITLHWIIDAASVVART